MDQNIEIYEMAYDAKRGVFTNGNEMDEQVYGVQEYIDDHLGHVIFDDFDIKRVEGFQAKDFIFRNRNSEYHIFVDNKDIDMINLLSDYQKKGRNKSRKLKIKTSKDIKKKIKRGYILAGIVSTMVMSGISYAAGSGMIEETIDNVQTYMEEVQAEKEERVRKEKVGPILRFLIQERTIMSEIGTLLSAENQAYNKSDDKLYETASYIYLGLEDSYQQDEIDEMMAGGVLSEEGKLVVKSYMRNLAKEDFEYVDTGVQR